MLEIFYLLFGLGIGRRASLAPRNAAGTTNLVKSQTAEDKSINGKVTWHETRSPGDLAFALETAEDQEALEFADSIAASYNEELENPDFTYSQDNVGVGSGSMPSPHRPDFLPSYVAYDTDWFPAVDAEPIRGWHPALRVVVVDRLLTGEEILLERKRVCQYVGQNPGEPIDRASFLLHARREHRPPVEKFEGSPDCLYFYYAYCDSGD